MQSALVLLRVLLSLAVVFGLIWYLYKRIGSSRRGGRKNPVTVIGRQGVGSKANIVTIETDGRRLTLGVTEHTITVLHETEAPEPDFDEAMARVDADGLEGAAAGPAGSTITDTTPVVVTDTTPVAGSILSAATWKQAARFVKQAMK